MPEGVAEYWDMDAFRTSIKTKRELFPLLAFLPFRAGGARLLNGSRGRELAGAFYVIRRGPTANFLGSLHATQDYIVSDLLTTSYAAEPEAAS